MLNIHGRTIWKISKRFLSKMSMTAKPKKQRLSLRQMRPKWRYLLTFAQQKPNTAYQLSGTVLERWWLGPVLQPQDLNTLRSTRKLGNIPKYFTVKYEAISLAGKSGLKVVIAPIYNMWKHKFTIGFKGYVPNSCSVLTTMCTLINQLQGKTLQARVQLKKMKQMCPKRKPENLQIKWWWFGHQSKSSA